ncbi:Ionotropic receptor 274 [Blattella germanica]|nr:Ionotropic receptor 273 [Blattella germanica]PSN38154.1 Ionotropic receptor 274 [Blattella germanica]
MKYPKVIFVLLYICAVSSPKLTHLEEHSIEESLAECIINISSRYFDEDKPVLVETPVNWFPGRYPYLEYGEKLIHMLQKENKFSLIIYGINGFLVETKVHVGAYIVLLPPILRSLDELFVERMLAAIHLMAYNFRGKTVVATVEDMTSSDKKKLQPIHVLKYAFKSELLNAILLVPRFLSKGKKLNNIYIYNWSPNEQSNICSYNIDKINHSDTWISQKKSFIFNTNIFPPHSKIDLKRCKLNLLLHNEPPFVIFSYKTRTVSGIITKLIDTILDYINGTLTYILPEHHQLPIVHFYFPLPLDPIYYEPDAIRDRVTYPYMRQEVTWFVPEGVQKDRWTSLVKTFSALVWSLVLLTFIFGSFTMWLINRSARISSNVTEEINYGVLGDAMLTHLGGGVNYRYKGFIASSFFMLWLYYCLVINTAYQSVFYGLLINPGYLPALETSKEVEESHLIKQITFAYPASAYWSKYLKYRYSSNAATGLKSVAVSRTHALLTTVWKAKFHYKSFSNNRYVPIKELVATHLYSIQVFKLNSIFFNLFNKVLGKFADGGIIDQMTNQYNKHSFRQNSPTTALSLSMDHLQVACYVLLIGCTSSLSVNIIEICVHFVISWFYLLSIKYNLKFMSLL